MKFLALALLLATGLNAVASTLPLDPNKLECRKVDGPEFSGGRPSATIAIFSEGEQIYPGIWITIPTNVTVDLLKCKSILAKAKAAKKNLLINLDYVNEAGQWMRDGYGDDQDTSWNQEDFLYIEGTIPPKQCK